MNATKTPTGSTGGLSIAPNTEYPSKTSHAIVRRHKLNQTWVISDEQRVHFTEGFAQGLMTNVQFAHKALPMKCHSGYESTGEAVGMLHRMLSEPELPDGVVRTVGVKYDSAKRLFVAKGTTEKVLNSADYLLLYCDGTALAAWRS